MGDDQFYPGPLLRIRRCLARRAAAFGKTRDDHREATLLYFILLHGPFAHADVDVLAQRLVVIETDPSGRDLVSRDITHQWKLRVEGQVFAPKLAANKRRVVGQEKNAPLKAD